MKKILKTFIFVCTLLSVSLTAAAQQNVTGVVSDEEGYPIPGATVVIVGTTTGTITNIDGVYNLTVEVGQVLDFSFIGMLTQKVEVTNQEEINIILVSSDIGLDEVVVIGYGQKKKITVTGSVSTISSEELLKSPTANVTNALAGKISGISAVQNTGQPGADEASLAIRGNRDILVIVDGVERSFSQIDPEEIESVSVLKDASATAVYGIRGGNGVLIVTTKRGEKGKAKISVSSSIGIQQPTILSKKSDSYTYATAHNERAANDGTPEENYVFGPEALEAFKNGGNLLYPDTDWNDYLFKKSAVQKKTNLTIRGGTDKVRYFVALGYLSQDGQLKDLDPRYDENFTFNRYNYRSNLDIDLTKSTLIKLSIGGRTEIRNQPKPKDDGDGIWKDGTWAQPMSGSGIVDGKWVTTSADNVSIEMKDPLNAFYGRGYTNNTRAFLSLDLDVIQKLDVVTKGLNVTLKGSYNTNYTHKKTRATSPNRYEAIKDPLDPENIVFRKINDEGTLNYTEPDPLKGRNWYLEAGLNYNRKFGSHDVSGLLLYNQRTVYYPDQFKEIPKRTLGLVGRLSYNYKTKYLIDFNLGYNGSENFPEGKRFDYFPAVSVGWIITEESFMANNGVFDYLKIRGSYGQVGNDRIGGSRFLYQPDAWNYQVDKGGYNFGYDLSNDQYGALEMRIGNPNVTWETITQRNIGIDAKFFDGKLGASFDMFHESREDMLITRQTVPGYVAAVLPAVNLKERENKGYELEVKWNDQIGDFRYYLSANLSYARNKIIYMDEVPQAHDYLARTGLPEGQPFAYITDGFFSEEVNTTTDANYADHGGIRYPGDVMYKDLNDDGMINDMDMKAVGYSPNVPEYNYGINAGFNWKAFDFSMTWAGVKNTSRLLPNVLRQPFAGQNRALYDHLYEGRWTPETAATAIYPRLSLASKDNNYKVSDMFYEDASFIRLKSVELGYTINTAGLRRVGLRNVRVFANGFNLLTFSKLDIFDPESRPGSAGLYPMTKMYNMGVKLNF